MQKITQHIIKAIDKATKIERARHPDWDDNKHRLNVLVDIDNDKEKITVTVTKENRMFNITPTTLKRIN